MAFASEDNLWALGAQGKPLSWFQFTFSHSLKFLFPQAWTYNPFTLGQLGLWSNLKHSILALPHLFWEFYTYWVKCPSWNKSKHGAYLNTRWKNEAPRSLWVPLPLERSRVVHVNHPKGSDAGENHQSEHTVLSPHCGVFNIKYNSIAIRGPQHFIN